MNNYSGISAFINTSSNIFSFTLSLSLSLDYLGSILNFYVSLI